MQLSFFYTAVLLAAGVAAQSCSSTITYCTGGACLCFADGITESLNEMCKGKGFERSLGPSKTTTEAGERCDTQCCTG
ncbi:hypothetical protein CPAR01_09527 [Colletotrichum paranaense]|uniref:Uncharacterized protein n=4 Tax=Colletotrichum acutatum species complex TaxID=2707335 RepID=A0A9Q0B766_9PEZI|nr:uncharacterized protein CPAR01_09527 [Colletotrichum paranaense]XP_060373766.1 uncharacterized protein CTAM01_15674 [Colletotrichum tamarilloi]XP_060394086.1 uncharacterized protein CABS01_02796 [Colletotrichum abscissum]KAK0381822.1 hypothetical protein CLIM01_00835 [Colletotrichum limetticola]KAI3555648.1 hypothetical protein CABS02_04024 [Colletotrichum abscissum]KAK1475228.1 hypothetical protein CTAM01_15674 [Colletotrichum tamarilloi]KAK1483060.1 hypothetical protein CABS01_02796 [Col